MNSKRQYKDYTNRLKSEIRKLKNRNNYLQTELNTFKKSQLDSSEDSFTKWDTWRFLIGFLGWVVAGVIFMLKF